MPSEVWTYARFVLGSMTHTERTLPKTARRWQRDGEAQRRGLIVASRRARADRRGRLERPGRTSESRRSTSRVSSSWTICMHQCTEGTPSSSLGGERKAKA
jgi:hypothetical protein